MTYSFCMICPYNSRILQTDTADCGALAICDRGDAVILCYLFLPLFGMVISFTETKVENITTVLKIGHILLVYKTY